MILKQKFYTCISIMALSACANTAYAVSLNCYTMRTASVGENPFLSIEYNKDGGGSIVAKFEGDKLPRKFPNILYIGFSEDNKRINYFASNDFFTGKKQMVDYDWSLTQVNQHEWSLYVKDNSANQTLYCNILTKDYFLTSNGYKYFTDDHYGVILDNNLTKAFKLNTDSTTQQLDGPTGSTGGPVRIEDYFSSGETKPGPHENKNKDK